MSIRTIQFRLGIGTMICSAFLIFYAIPNWVTSPANVPKIVLSPVFWPMVVAVFLALVGAGLLASARKFDKSADSISESSDTDHFAEYGRLAALAVLMIATVYVLPLLGLVWTSMLTIVALALLIQSRYPKTVVLCAIIVPLVLYAFFAHVAGVAIPQGIFLRLP
ncbi:tripartite tricarboxylate transporter TctB family protein [Granulosicoccus antarcticus]|uniref:DUF1468 domain-containing protein n=1 Tax=Granulosicoccus antarcticus IMCC3135 TaxID=1192854 RepID=A0A2Z2NVP3_9GAMM|nr:tripartite tricarboxylate transporter TctB family protein [Granulosicoccus antarcticus]ASJ72850.1 hypothetical protein IMCC3135_13825 [Granulosicoccus antarcticus IMCC3135]